ncbi:hypothetical protein NSA52_17030 [Clostridium sporogenes]|uniref:hypothetical protein n=1 Tax=Clostridium sporogenes TaxID=1509 RepID=UPI00214A6039|nr:hypothetical protein [Clostridium sporogenes]MCR1975815.1 hypothetical protein [Clostridium sporogenes]
MKEHLNTNKVNNNHLSIKGLIFSLLSTLGILILQELALHFTFLNYWEAYFIFSIVAFLFISATVYSKFCTGNENFLSIILVVFLNILLRYVFYYFIAILNLSLSNRVSYFQVIQSLPINTYIINTFFNNIMIYDDLQLTKDLFLGYHLLYLVLAIYYAKKEIYRAVFYKTTDSEAMINSIASEMKSKTIYNDEMKNHK